jgi:hypothetical protein
MIVSVAPNPATCKEIQHKGMSTYGFGSGKICYSDIMNEERLEATCTGDLRIMRIIYNESSKYTKAGIAYIPMKYSSTKTVFANCVRSDGIAPQHCKFQDSGACDNNYCAQPCTA